MEPATPNSVTQQLTRHLTTGRWPAATPGIGRHTHDGPDDSLRPRTEAPCARRLHRGAADDAAARKQPKRGRPGADYSNASNQKYTEMDDITHMSHGSQSQSCSNPVITTAKKVLAIDTQWQQTCNTALLALAQSSARTMGSSHRTGRVVQTDHGCSPGLLSWWAQPMGFGHQDTSPQQCGMHSSSKTILHPATHLHSAANSSTHTQNTVNKFFIPTIGTGHTPGPDLLTHGMRSPITIRQLSIRRSGHSWICICKVGTSQPAQGHHNQKKQPHESDKQGADL